MLTVDDRGSLEVAGLLLRQLASTITRDWSIY